MRNLEVSVAQSGGSSCGKSGWRRIKAVLDPDIVIQLQRQRPGQADAARAFQVLANIQRRSLQKESQIEQGHLMPDHVSDPNSRFERPHLAPARHPLHDDYCSARAFAVNPSRLRRDPAGFGG